MAAHNIHLNHWRMANETGNFTYTFDFEASVGVSSMSIITFVFISALLIFYYRGDKFVGCWGSPNNSILLFLGILITTLSTLSKNDLNFHAVYVIFLLLLVGILVTAAGAHFFFSAPKENEKPISYYHQHISLLIWVVTIPLVLMELLEFIGALTVETHSYKAALNIVALLQKLIQASVYHFSLRHKVPRADKKQGASWYLRIVALLNYAMWLHSMAKTEEKAVEKMFGRGLAIMSTASIALLIDYRLLCCMMFAEHSTEVYEQHDCERRQVGEGVIIVNNVTKFKIRSSQMSGMGYVFGFVILSLQLICGLQNYGLVGIWTNLFAIIADILVVALGFVLLHQDSKPEKTSTEWRRTDAKGVDLMVAIMGITGLIYWIIMVILHGSWLYKIDSLDEEMILFLQWSCTKNVFRAIGIVLQLYIFIKCDPFLGCRKSVKGKPAIYFILPALMFSLLSIFVMAIMDGHVKVVEELIELSRISDMLLGFMKISEPLYLGFCLHLFLHFFILYNNVRALQLRTVEQNESVEIDNLVS